MIITFNCFEEKVQQLLKQETDQTDLTLEEYLRCILKISDDFKQKKIGFEDLFCILESAFRTVPPEFNESWMSSNQPCMMDDVSDTYPCFLDTILFQISDLRKMRLAGYYDNKNIYYGIDSPTGNRWYNFDPLTYIECGVAGLEGRFECGYFDESKVGWNILVFLLEFGRIYE